MESESQHDHETGLETVIEADTPQPVELLWPSIETFTGHTRAMHGRFEDLFNNQDKQTPSPIQRTRNECIYHITTGGKDYKSPTYELRYLHSGRTDDARFIYLFDDKGDVIHWALHFIPDDRGTYSLIDFRNTKVQCEVRHKVQELQLNVKHVDKCHLVEQSLLVALKTLAQVNDLLEPVADACR